MCKKLTFTLNFLLGFLIHFATFALLIKFWTNFLSLVYDPNECNHSFSNIFNLQVIKYFCNYFVDKLNIIELHLTHFESHYFYSILVHFKRKLYPTAKLLLLLLVEVFFLILFIYLLQTYYLLIDNGVKNYYNFSLLIYLRQLWLTIWRKKFKIFFASFFFQ